MKKGLVSLIFIIVASTIHSQTFKNYCDTACNYIINGKTTPVLPVLQKVYGSFMTENDKFFKIAEELETMRVNDQAVRFLLMDTQKRFGKESCEYEKVHKYMTGLDKENTLRAKNIIEQYGWLSKEDVGDDAEEGLFLIVQHSVDSAFQSRCLEKLRQAVKDDESLKWQYAFLVDRFAMNNGERQVYGTQKIEIDGVPYPVPLKNPRRVDSLRKKMGMESLWKELQEDYGGKWNLKKYIESESKSEEVYSNWLKKNRNVR